MKRLWSLLLLVLPLGSATATWSIVALDSASGQLAIASATCAANGPDQLKLFQAIVVPGVGVAAAQAAIDTSQAAHRVIYEGLLAGTPPDQIIYRLLRDPQVATRQFAIIDRYGRVAMHTGGENASVAVHRSGRSTDGIVWSVQGNLLASILVVEAAAQAMDASGGTLADRMMHAMDAADRNGGDLRCSCATGPSWPVGVTCTQRHASVAYLLIADPGDAVGQYALLHPQITGLPPLTTTSLYAPWNDGEYFLYLAVYPSNLHPGEDANPVLTLRRRYEEWKSNRP